MLIIAECKRRIRMEGDDRVEGEVGRCEEENEGWVGHGGEMDLEIEERKERKEGEEKEEERGGATEENEREQKS